MPDTVKFKCPKCGDIKACPPSAGNPGVYYFQCKDCNLEGWRHIGMRHKELCGEHQEGWPEGVKCNMLKGHQPNSSPNGPHEPDKSLFRAYSQVCYPINSKTGPF